MNIDSIRNGIVIDHITAGRGMRLYELLELDNPEMSIAIIKNAPSRKRGRKDIIKIDADIPIDLDIIGYVDPGATVDVIRNSQVVEKKIIDMPQKLVNVLKCKNPRCITSCEQELDNIFVLADRDKKEYRCLYCETKAEAAR